MRWTTCSVMQVAYRHATPRHALRERVAGVNPDSQAAGRGLSSVAYRPVAGSDAATRTRVQRDVERWSKLVRELDLEPE